LFAKPANVIVLDEPTNDLDTETLELLEERLVEYQGTVLVVSHDRAFLNNVVSSSIVFESGGVKEYVGGYDDWLRQKSEESPSAASAVKKEKSKKQQPGTSNGKRRLKYKEKQELTALPGQIEQIETETSALHETMSDPDFYQQPSEQITAEQARLAELESQLAALFQRWEELEQFAN
jgi:ATP-binding cassette subfamily F protein uup